MLFTTYTKSLNNLYKSLLKNFVISDYFYPGLISFPIFLILLFSSLSKISELLYNYVSYQRECLNFSSE